MDSAAGKGGKVSWVAEALPHSEGAAYKRHCREVAACLRDWRMGSYYARMDRDNITRTGAKDPWGREAVPPEQRLAETRPGPDTEPDQRVRCGSERRVDANRMGRGVCREQA